VSLSYFLFMRRRKTMDSETKQKVLVIREQMWKEIDEILKKAEERILQIKVNIE